MFHSDKYDLNWSVISLGYWCCCWQWVRQTIETDRTCKMVFNVSEQSTIHLRWCLVPVLLLWCWCYFPQEASAAWQCRRGMLMGESLLEPFSYQPVSRKILRLLSENRIIPCKKQQIGFVQQWRAEFISFLCVLAFNSKPKKKTYRKWSHCVPAHLQLSCFALMNNDIRFSTLQKQKTRPLKEEH